MAKRFTTLINITTSLLSLRANAIAATATAADAQQAPAPPPSPPPPLVPRTWNARQYGCKCYFGDACWPAPREWASLNGSVDGNLAVYVPPEAACHDFFDGTLGTIPTYDREKCDALKVNYNNEKWV